MAFGGIASIIGRYVGAGSVVSLRELTITHHTAVSRCTSSCYLLSGRLLYYQQKGSREPASYIFALYGAQSTTA